MPRGPRHSVHWDSLSDEIEHIFRNLRATAVAFTESVGRRPDSYGLIDIATLRPRIVAMLDDFSGLAVGTGVVPSAGLLEDARHWLEWWWRGPTGSPEALRVNLDPESPDFFDYPRAEWFEVPRATCLPHVAGPYVDYACTNEYAFTFAVPALLDEAFIGVVAMDVPCARLEARIMPALTGETDVRALLTSTGRVIASNTAELVPSLHVTASPSASPDPRELIALDRLTELTGWRLYR